MNSEITWFGKPEKGKIKTSEEQGKWAQDFEHCITFLLLCNKLQKQNKTKNLAPYNNKHLLPHSFWEQWIWKRLAGWLRLRISYELQSSCWLGLYYLKAWLRLKNQFWRELNHQAIGRRPGFSLTVGWSSWIFTTWVSIQGSLNVLKIWKLAFPKATDQWERQWERESMVFL